MSDFTRYSIDMKQGDRVYMFTDGFPDQFGGPQGMFVIESAIYDLWGQLYKAPLYKLLGGGNGQLSTDVTISVDAIDKLKMQVNDLIEEQNYENSVRVEENERGIETSA